MFENYTYMFKATCPRGQWIKLLGHLLTYLVSPDHGVLTVTKHASEWDGGWLFKSHVNENVEHFPHSYTLNSSLCKFSTCCWKDRRPPTAVNWIPETLGLSRPNIASFWSHFDSKKCTTWVILWIHQTYPMPRPYGPAQTPCVIAEEVGASFGVSYELGNMYWVY